MRTPDVLPTFTIKIDGRPYQGEHSGTEPAPPRSAYFSPVTRNKITIGHPLDLPMSIQGTRNLRSHVDRILTRMSEGHGFQSVEITRLAGGGK